jgi:hypothetical protein
MKRTSCVILSLLILWSAVGFSVNAHFCGSQIVGLALFGEAEVCQMKLDSIDSCENEEPSCCKNEQIIVEGQEHISSKQQTKVSFENLEFKTIAVFYSSIVTLFQTEAVLVYSDKYTPPEIEKEITILVQFFLL